MTYVGIDPGRSGGVCVLYDNNFTSTTEMPEFRCDLLTWMVNKLSACKPPYHVIVEQVGGYMGTRSKGKGGGADGGGGNTGQSMFVFGQCYGEILMCLDALKGLAKLDLKYATIMPNVWQRGLSIPPKGRGLAAESKTEYKARLASVARLTFPQRTVTLKTADAMLIAHYSRRIHKW